VGLTTGNHSRFQNTIRGEAFFLRGIPLRVSGTCNNNIGVDPVFEWRENWCENIEKATKWLWA
jgi:hypothetical protein